MSAARHARAVGLQQHQQPAFPARRARAQRDGTEHSLPRERRVPSPVEHTHIHTGAFRTVLFLCGRTEVGEHKLYLYPSFRSLFSHSLHFNSFTLSWIFIIIIFFILYFVYFLGFFFPSFFRPSFSFFVLSCISALFLLFTLLLFLVRSFSHYIHLVFHFLLFTLSLYFYTFFLYYSICIYFLLFDLSFFLSFFFLSFTILYLFIHSFFCRKYKIPWYRWLCRSQFLKSFYLYDCQLQYCDHIFPC